MLSEEEWMDRLALEGKELMKEEPTFKPVGGSWTHWRGEMLGTGVYEGGVFLVDIRIPREYPFQHPEIRWLTNTWHPNIFRDRVCVGILGKDWSPANSLVDVVETMRFLLSNPNPKDPLNTTAARQFLQDFDKFAAKCREYVKRFATWGQRPPP
ncbi:MAG: ubiquitin-conjugating enzyme family protein [Candidatus Thorarchaeota archaeon]